MTLSLLSAWCALLIGVLWVRSPSPLLGMVGLLAAGAMTWGIRGPTVGRRRRVLLALLGWGLVGIVGRHHLRPDVVPPSADTGDLSQAGEALRVAVAAEGDRLIATARQATAVSADRATAFASLASLLPTEVDRAVVLAEGGRPFAWSGRLLVPLDSLRGPVGAIITPFYVVLYAVHVEGARVGIATSLVHASRPALALSRPLDRALPEVTAEDFAYGEVAAAVGVPGAVVLEVAGRPVLAARGTLASPAARALALTERAQWWTVTVLCGIALLAMALAWRREAPGAVRLVTLSLLAGLILLTPLSRFSNRSVWFDPLTYFTPIGGPATGTAAALALSAALVFMALLTAMRAAIRPRSRLVAVGLVALVAGIGPFVLRELARGIRVPLTGITVAHWVAWQLPLFLAAASVLLAGVAAGRPLVGQRVGLPRWMAPLLAASAAILTPVVLHGAGRLPATFPLLWVAAIIALALTKRRRTLVLPVAFVAACGSVTTIWTATVRDRMALAAADIQGLTSSDRDGIALLERFAQQLAVTSAARSRVALLEAYTRSDLAAASRPAEVATWDPDGSLIAELRVRRAPGLTAGVERFAAEARLSGAPFIREAEGEPGRHLILAIPHGDGTVTTVVLAPATSLVRPDAFGALLGFDSPPTVDPPYRLALGRSPSSAAAGEGARRWERDGTELHGDWLLPAVDGEERRIHATVELRSLDALVMRGTLLVLADLAMLGTLWLLLLMADGVLIRWWRIRSGDLLGSFRSRLSGALFAAFTVPSMLFGWWSLDRLQTEDAQRRDLIIRETLRGIAASASAAELAAAAARFETPLFLYADGLLLTTSDPLLDALAPLGRLLPADIDLTLAEGEEPSAGALTTVGGDLVRLGYRAAVAADGTPLVLAAPARLDDRLLDRQRDDLTIFLLFALSLGGLVALVASGAGARQLSRPIRILRHRALALARGEGESESEGERIAVPPAEFVPVFRAFDRMTIDLAESRRELEAARRRLAATLRNVASGVIAVGDHGEITVVNPRAEQILGVPIPTGCLADAVLGAPLDSWLAAFRSRRDEEATIELERDRRRLSVRAVRLALDTGRVVVTLDDVTDVVRAERVLAWGEMARQVAHEIKNPLTPIRLGVQHLRRARQDGRVDFDAAFEPTTARILAEIDRLDEIARTFSRYGVAPLGDAPPVPVDLTPVARDLLALERLGSETVTWVGEIPEGSVIVAAEERALRDVLMNLLENARLAGARTVRLAITPEASGGATLTVRDDGEGIDPATLERIFEPHFSTRTSGSGLGLAVSRRLIERWGGTISATSARGAGTVLTVRLAGASSPVPLSFPDDGHR